LFPSFWSRLLVAVPIISDQAVDYFSIILDQAVGHCCYYFGSGCWLLLPLFWIRLLVTVHIIINSLFQKNGKSNQQPDPKQYEQ
jgi:uncharacterized membrane protein